MTPARAWRILGITPTSEVSDIKRAYAGKLKAIDPDEQLKAFETLREAFLLARHLAQQVKWAEANENFAEGDDANLDPHVVAAVKDDRVHDTALSTSGVFDVEDNIAENERDPRDRLGELLWNEVEPGVGAIERETIVLLRHPMFDNVDFANETEHWLARLAVETIPRSDPILPLLADQFGWHQFGNAVYVDQAIAGVLARIGDLDTLDRLRSPAHKWHRAMNLLQQPAPAAISAGTRNLMRTPVADFLDSIRYHNPALLWELDSDHVKLWDDLIAEQHRNPAALRSDGISWFGWLVIAAAIANLFVLIR